MKTLAAFILLTLICFVHHSSAAVKGAVLATSGGCCINITQMIIPRPKVKHVAENPSHCTNKAIIITSVCDKEFCFDPDFPRAKRLLAEFENFRDKKSPFNRSKCGEKKE